MKNILKHKYSVQRTSAINRGIDWQFTYDTWIEWWGKDIANRGRLKGQLVMARYNDIGPYHPDNVRKATCSENNSEGIKPRANSKKNTTVFAQLTCPHCNFTTNKGNAKQWHFDNCKGKI
jgi:hypothetical protein